MLSFLNKRVEMVCGRMLFVEVQEELSEKATTLANSQVVVFTTMNSLAFAGGAFAVAGEDQAGIFMSEIIPEKIRDQIFYHELGHVVGRHMWKDQSTLSDADRMVMEFEADNFMVRSVGKAKAIKALGDLVQNMNQSQKLSGYIRILAMTFGKWTWGPLSKLLILDKIQA